MKKQLLIAAVAATMTSVAMADISISGAAQVNWTNTDTQNADSVNTVTHDMDLKITGKSGNTSFVMDIENLSATGNTDGLKTKNAYMTTSIAGANVKIGDFYGSDSLLGNGTNTAGQISVDYTMSGVKAQYEYAAAGDESVTLSGAVSGVSISHEMHQSGNTDTKIGGTFSGVTVAYRDYDVDNTSTGDKTSTEISTVVSGVTVTYANVDVTAATTTSDAFFGDTTMAEATGFGLSTSVAGNKVTFKSFDLKPAVGNADDSVTKIIVNRALASGATLEVTYADTDAGDARADKTSLDIELAVKF
jgi:hypothetical protein